MARRGGQWQTRTDADKHGRAKRGDFKAQISNFKVVEWRGHEKSCYRASLSGWRGCFKNFTREGPPLLPVFPDGHQEEREKIIVGRRTQGVALGYHLPPFQGF